MNEVAPSKIRISCLKTDCDNGLHCYRPKPRTWTDPSGECLGCGDRSVDWDRVKRRDIADGKALQGELQREWIRHHFWEKPIDMQSRDLLLSMSREELRTRVWNHLAKAVAPARPWRDGTQVPVDDDKLAGHPIFYAQHATAACCKKCAYYWWGLPRDEQYTHQQIDFLTDMCIGFFDTRGLLRNDRA